MTTWVALNLRSNAVMIDITSRDVACSTRHTTSAYFAIGTELQIPATATTLVSMLVLWYRNGVYNTVENSGIFSLI